MLCSAIMIIFVVPIAIAWVRVTITIPGSADRWFVYCNETVTVHARVRSGLWRPNKGHNDISNPNYYQIPVSVIWSLTTDMPTGAGSISSPSTTDSYGLTTTTYTAPGTTGGPSKLGHTTVNGLTAAPGTGAKSFQIRGIPSKPPSPDPSATQFSDYLALVKKYINLSTEQTAKDVLSEQENECPAITYDPSLPDTRSGLTKIDKNTNACKSVSFGKSALRDVDEFIKTVIHEAGHIRAKNSTQPDKDNDGAREDFDLDDNSWEPNALEDFLHQFETDHNPGNICS